MALTLTFNPKYEWKSSEKVWIAIALEKYYMNSPAFAHLMDTQYNEVSIIIPTHSLIDKNVPEHMGMHFNIVLYNNFKGAKRTATVESNTIHCTWNFKESCEIYKMTMITEL
jgi:hypothetical protein